MILYIELINYRSPRRSCMVAEEGSQVQDNPTDQEDERICDGLENMVERFATGWKENWPWSMAAASQWFHDCWLVLRRMRRAYWPAFGSCRVSMVGILCSGWGSNRGISYRCGWCLVGFDTNGKLAAAKAKSKTWLGSWRWWAEK